MADITASVLGASDAQDAPHNGAQNDAQNDWLRLSVPAHPRAIASVQALLVAQARHHGFTPAQQTRMQTAAEEGLLTVLHYAHDDAPDAAAASTLDILLTVLPAVLQLRITNHGLPYDQSLVSEYDPQQPASAEDDQTGLSAFLMHRLADRSRVLNLGAQGQHVELEWWLPQQGSLVATPASTPGAANASAAAGAAPLPTTVRPLEPGDAIHLARLMYRTYGYSYANPDMYLADRILERCADGRLTSWVAQLATPDGSSAPIVGHIALIKNHRDDPVLEVGSAMVGPDQRGSGLLGKLLEAVTQALEQRPEAAAFVHAVTRHPYTQKTFGRLGYLPTALMLGYIPASAQFRSIPGHASTQRVSAFYSCRLLRPVAPIDVYLPPDLASLVLPRATEIGMELRPQPLQRAALQGATQMETQVVPALNAAFVVAQHAGADWPEVLQRNLRQWCRQKVDAIYLSLDLRDPHTPAAWQAAAQLGFLPAGLTPYMPWPATLALQYLNNQWLEVDHIVSVGPAAEALRDQIFAAYRQRECL